MDPYYLAFLRNNILERRASLALITSIPNTELLLKKELHKQVTNTFGNIDHFYVYSLIDQKGVKTEKMVGKFRISDIAPDTLVSATVLGKHKYLKGRNILIHDSENSVNHIFRSNSDSDNFIITDLVPLIDILAKTQDWEVTQRIMAFPALESELDYYRKLVKDQKKQIQELRIKK